MVLILELAIELALSGSPPCWFILQFLDLSASMILQNCVSQPFESFCMYICIPGGSDGSESACNEETWVQSLGWEDPLEKGMATHSSILAWRIPWTEESSGLQSMGSQRANTTEQLTHIHTHPQPVGSASLEGTD